MTRCILLSLLLGSFAVASEVPSSQVCNDVLVSRVLQKASMRLVEDLPHILESEGSTTLLLRIPIEQLSVPLSELANPAWVRSSQVQYLSDFVAVHEQAWYAIINGPAKELLAAQSALLETYGKKRVRFEILGTRSPDLHFAPPPLEQNFEFGLSEIGAADRWDGIFKSGLPTVVKDPRSGALLYAIPQSLSFTMNSFLLNGLGIEALPRPTKPVVETLKAQNLRSSFIWGVRGYWILSQPAYRALKALEEKQTRREGPVSNENVLVFCDKKSPRARARLRIAKRAP